MRAILTSVTKGLRRLLPRTPQAQSSALFPQSPGPGGFGMQISPPGPFTTLGRTISSFWRMPHCQLLDKVCVTSFMPGWSPPTVSPSSPALFAAKYIERNTKIGRKADALRPPAFLNCPLRARASREGLFAYFVRTWQARLGSFGVAIRTGCSRSGASY